MAPKTVDEFYQAFEASNADEEKILVDAGMELTGKDLNTLKARIARKKEKMTKGGKGKETGKSESSFVDIGKEGERDLIKEQKFVEKFWEELEAMDPVTLVSDEVTDAFKYIGFDPDIVMREMIHRGKKAGKDGNQIMKDLVDIVNIAIIKGSVTEKNLKKTSDTGKVIYSNLQKVYELQTGGVKGKDSTHLTVARVAAAVPGIVTKVLVKRPDFSKTFIGPFGSKSLPPYLRHQAAAACIPEAISEKLKDYLLGLITAFTADQSKTLANKKDSADVLFDEQQNYVMTTHNSKHPSESQRTKIFQNFSLSNDFEKLNVVAVKVKKVKPEFVALTQQELDTELVK